MTFCSSVSWFRAEEAEEGRGWGPRGDGGGAGLHCAASAWRCDGAAARGAGEGPRESGLQDSVTLVLRMQVAAPFHSGWNGGSYWGIPDPLPES